jgi:hypothetical protein
MSDERTRRPPTDDRTPEAQRPPVPGDVPNEEEVEREFPAGRDVPLREQRDLVDETGDDIRQYTGEPVETEHGTVIPTQMAVGAQRVVGGGEFPSAPPRGTTDAAGRRPEDEQEDDR